MDPEAFEERIRKVLEAGDRKALNRLLPRQHLNKEGRRVATTGTPEEVKNAFIINSLARKAVTDTEDEKLISVYYHRVPYLNVGAYLHSRPDVVRYLLDEDVDLSGEDSLASALAGKEDLETLGLILQKYPKLIESALYGAIVDGKIEVLDYLLTLEGADLEQVVTDIMDNDGGIESQGMLEYLLTLMPEADLCLLEM